MKKLIALLLSLLMVFSFSACSELGISEEEITSAVVDAIIEGIENGISESVSQEDTETSILESETKDEANYEDVIIEEGILTKEELDKYLHPKDMITV